MLIRARMKAWLATALCAACASPTGIAGDTSPDNPPAFPDELGGKADGPPQKVVDGTGVVMAAPTVVNVYWGAYWPSDAGTADRMVIDGFTSQVGASSWWGITAEYPDAHDAPGAPAQGAPVLVSDSEPPNQKLHSTDVEIHQFLDAAFANGALAYDAETLYAVFSPPGTREPRGECGHHSYYTTTSVGDGHKHKVIYALIPYLTDTDTSCAGGASANGTSLDEITVTFSHEIAESVTDPYLDAWGKGSSNEIADQCDNGFVASWGGAQFAVQQLWSNNAFACLSDPANAAGG